MARVDTTAPSEVADANKAGSTELDALDVLLILTRHHKLTVWFPVLVTCVVTLLAFLLPNIYTASTRLLPPPQQSMTPLAALAGQVGALNGMDVAALGIRNPNDLYVGMLRSRTISDALITKFKLASVYGTSTQEDARKELADRTRITAGKDGIIELSYDDTDPRRAADIANAYTDALRGLTKTLAISQAGLRRAFFEKQLPAAKAALAQAEQDLKTTQQKTGVVIPDEQGRSLIEAVAIMRAQIAAKQVELDATRTFATDQHPDVRRIRSQIAALQRELTTVERSKDSGSDGLLSSTRNIPEAGLEFMRRYREVKFQEALFDVLLKQFEAARLDEANDSGIVQVVDSAVAPDKKSRPRRGLIALITLFLTGLFGVLAAFLRHYYETGRIDHARGARFTMLLNNFRAIFRVKPK